MLRTPLLFLLLACACSSGESGKAAGTDALPGVDEPEKANATAPDRFRVRFETTRGDFTIEAVREWAPHGVDRLYNLVRIGFFTDIAVFRVVPGFVAQFGIHGDPEVSSVWRNRSIEADPVRLSNERGTVSFAMRNRPDTRTTQLFINYGDNSRLDAQGFAPVAKVTEGMPVVDAFHGGYGNNVPQPDINAWGNRYLRKQYPKLDYIKRATLLSD